MCLRNLHFNQTPLVTINEPLASFNHSLAGLVEPILVCLNSGLCPKAKIIHKFSIGLRFVLRDSRVINLVLTCSILSKPVLMCVWYYCPGQPYSCWFEMELNVEVVLLIHHSSQFMQYQCCHCQYSPGAWWYHHHTGSVLIYCFWVWKPQLYASKVLSWWVNGSIFSCLTRKLFSKRHLLVHMGVCYFQSSSKVLTFEQRHWCPLSQ